MYVTCSEKEFFPYSLVYFPFLQSSKSTMHSRIDIIFFLKCWNDSGVIALCMNTDVWQKMMWDLMQIQNCKFYTPTYLTLYVSNIFYRHNLKKINHSSLWKVSRDKFVIIPCIFSAGKENHVVNWWKKSHYK